MSEQPKETERERLDREYHELVRQTEADMEALGMKLAPRSGSLHRAGRCCRANAKMWLLCIPVWLLIIPLAQRANMLDWWAWVGGVGTGHVAGMFALYAVILNPRRSNIPAKTITSANKNEC